MASLHLKSFDVHVLRVMERSCVSEAEVVCVALLDGEKWWLHEVRVVGGQLMYRQAVPG